MNENCKHITIVNPDGEVLLDCESNCIFLVCNDPAKDLTSTLSAISANGNTIVNMLQRVDELKETILDDKPQLRLLYGLFTSGALRPRDEDEGIADDLPRDLARLFDSFRDD